MRTVRAIAVVIPNPRDDAQLLAVRRPDDDAELPGVWGLPATTLRPMESDAAAARRLGESKLGSPVTLGALLAEGTQARRDHELTMRLYAATMPATEPELPSLGAATGSTLYTDWRWAPVSALAEGAANGSLCCALALQAHGAEAR